MKKMMLSFLLFLAIAGVAWAFVSNRSVGYKTVGPAEFAAFVGDTAVQLIDVRTPSEYVEGHLYGAVLINVQDSDFLKRATAQLVQECPVAVYCRSGRRSASAACLLVKAGYEVVNLDGGIMAWQSEGCEVVRDGE